jgi:hypothetical protein
MAHIVVNLPPVRCYVRAEFLYDFEKGFGEFEPCFWVSLKSIRGEAFRIEAYLTNYGALYDKLPLHAYVWKTDVSDDELLPLDHLQLWDALSYDVTLIEKKLLSNLRCKFYTKGKKFMHGDYMFTLDSASPDPNIINTTFSEDIQDHKSYNFIKCDNGQFAAQPNNRMLVFEPSNNPEQLKFPDFKVATRKWSVEREAKWALGDTTTVMYLKEDELKEIKDGK